VGPAEAISVVVWSAMAVKGRPGHCRHGLDCHLVDAGEAGRPEEVGDPNMIGSLLACERSGNIVYCHLGSLKFPQQYISSQTSAAGLDFEFVTLPCRADSYNATGQLLGGGGPTPVLPGPCGHVCVGGGAVVFFDV
jgi:hypothetical protein